MRLQIVKHYMKHTDLKYGGFKNGKESRYIW